MLTSSQFHTFICSSKYDSFHVLPFISIFIVHCSYEIILWFLREYKAVHRSVLSGNWMPYFLGSKAHNHVRNQKLFYLHHSCVVSKSKFKGKWNLKKQVVKDKSHSSHCCFWILLSTYTIIFLQIQLSLLWNVPGGKERK